jgi:hypothetical protein
LHVGKSSSFLRNWLGLSPQRKNEPNRQKSEIVILFILKMEAILASEPDIIVLALTAMGTPDPK